MDRVLANDRQDADADLERALALNPGDATVVRQKAMLRAALGRITEAIVLARRATELDPLSSLAWWTVGNIEFRAGNLDAAEAALSRSVDSSPEQDRAHRDLGFLQLMRGRPQQALPFFERPRDELFRLTGFALARHDLGKPREAEDALQNILRRFMPKAAYQVAEIYAWWQKPDLAFQWLERSWQERDPGLTYLKLDPLLRSLHQDPRWGPLLREVGLPPD
ncbi:MAG TPA: tetratricopeptide repeat protein [Myxococcales bacterium]